MSKYANTIPAEDEKRILDLFYRPSTATALSLEEIAEKMQNKYTPAQIKSIIFNDIEKKEDLWT